VIRSFINEVFYIVKQQAVSFNFYSSSSLTARVYWPFQFWTWHCEEHLFVC